MLSQRAGNAAVHEDVQATDVYTLARLLSLDVAVGALAGGVLAVEVLQVAMPWAWYAVLPLAVWVVYTLDHLLDARRVGHGAHTPRHRFHNRHRRLLGILCLAAAAVCAVLALTRLSLTGIAFGLGMTGLVVLHLLLVRLVGQRTSPWLVKELGVAAIYTLGIWGLPLLHRGPGLRPLHGLIVGQFFALAMINLLEFSLYERRIDALDGHTSFVLAIGPKRARCLIVLLLAGVGLSVLGGMMAGRDEGVWIVEGLLLAMAATLAAVAAWPSYFALRERYRAWGDAVFLFPLVLLLI